MFKTFAKPDIDSQNQRKKLRRIIKAIKLILHNLLRRFYEDFQAHMVNAEYASTACSLSTMGGLWSFKAAHFEGLKAIVNRSNNSPFGLRSFVKSELASQNNARSCAEC